MNAGPPIHVLEINQSALRSTLNLIFSEVGSDETGDKGYGDERDIRDERSHDPSDTQPKGRTVFGVPRGWGLVVSISSRDPMYEGEYLC